MATGFAGNRDSHRLIDKLRGIGKLSEAEISALDLLPLPPKNLQDGEDIVREGDRPTQCFVVLDGLVGRYKLLPNGKRQILSFHPPGDIPDLQCIFLNTLDHNIAALTRSRIALIDHDQFQILIMRHPPLGALFWRDSLIDAAIFREWMVGLGRRSAHERVAHLFCEMAVRFNAVGIGNADSYPFPVTQAELADALGLTVVHVNRVLRNLREEGIVRMENSVVTILDRERMWQLAEFSPDYLHQNDEWRPAEVAGGRPPSSSV